MKALVLYVAVLTVAAALPAHAQWQDPKVKIIGDVRNGPPLEPRPSLPELPIPPWGPRSFYASSKLLNLSSLGYVTAAHPLTCGISIGAGGRVVLIRAVGPSLAAFNVASPLAQPSIDLFDSKKRLATSVPWSETSADTRKEVRDAAAAVAAFPLTEGSKDAVLLAILPEGTYTCVVSGLQASEGSVLLEAYHVESLAIQSQ